MPQPAPPVPQIPAGWYPNQADFDTWITHPISFLSQPANFRAQHQAAKALSGFTLIPCDTILEDPYSGWSATSTGSQPAFSWLCPAGCSGWYEATLSGFTANQGGSSDQVVTAIYLNGSIWQYGSDDWAVNGGDAGSSGATMGPLRGGFDYVQLYVFSTASVSTPAVAGQFPALELQWVSS
jgi:hypothetical protein